MLHKAALTYMDDIIFTSLLIVFQNQRDGVSKTSLSDFGKTNESDVKIVPFPSHAEHTCLLIRSLSLIWGEHIPAGACPTWTDGTWGSLAQVFEHLADVYWEIKR